jgi:hypothetical protein
VAVRDKINSLVRRPEDWLPPVPPPSVTALGTGTKAEFNTALTDGDFVFVGDMVRAIAFQVVTTTPLASEILCLYCSVDAFTIAANMTGSVGSIITNPTATFVIDVQQQVGGAGAFTSIGTISTSTGGVITWTTVSGTSKAIAAGDIIKFIGDSDGDATFIGAFTIKGAIS